MQTFLDKTTIFRNFWKNPKNTGAIVGYGTASIHNALRDIPRDTVHHILEVGPATGGTTEYICNHKSVESTLVCCEINADFCSILKQRFPTVSIVHADFLQRTTTVQYDLIVSGVPMSLLSQEDQIAMLRKTYDVLAPGGTYVHIQYSHALVKYAERIFDAVDYTYCFKDFPFTCAVIASRKK